MKSSEIAKAAGVSVRALRHYHALGLLPEPPRQANGYRDYTVLDLARLLHIKQLAALGFSLEEVGRMLDQQDAENPAGGSDAEEAALAQLDADLAAQIERLEEQRRLVAQLREERLDPGLPVRFARTVKRLYRPPTASEEALAYDRASMAIAAYFYDDASLDELERFADAAEQMGLIGPLQQLEHRIDQLPANAPEAERAQLAAEALALLEPALASFDLANWENAPESDEAQLVDALSRATLNPAQRDVEQRIDAAIVARLRERADS